jgi:hypothetical protein
LPKPYLVPDSGREKPTHNFIDGVERNLNHPLTFEIPSNTEKNALRQGDYIKVGVIIDNETDEGERFWMQVRHITPSGTIVGIIDNDLIFTDFHNLVCGQELCVEKQHILEIIDKSCHSYFAPYV